MRRPVRLSRRVATGGVESPVVEVCRTDIDRLLDPPYVAHPAGRPEESRLRLAG
jgi:predicted alpha/beta-hydrolase family hydrolase